MKSKYVYVWASRVKESYTAQKMKFSIKDFFSKCDQIRRKLRIWSHLLKKSLTKNFIFCAVLGKFFGKFCARTKWMIPKFRSYPNFFSRKKTFITRENKSNKYLESILDDLKNYLV